MKYTILISIFIMSLLFATACTENVKQIATIQISLVDAPADYEAVYIDIEDVQINTSGEDTGEDGWQSLESANQGVYDLLKLTNGEEAFLGEIDLPEGQLGQIRLILGDSNILVVSGESKMLTIPSASKSGLKINVGAQIEGGITYKLILDFDAAKSVVAAGGSGRFNLKPVIRARMEAQSGAISGVVSPAESGSVVYALIAGDSLATYPDESGQFLIRALPAGTYEVLAVASELQVSASQNATVLEGQVVRLDTIFLN